MLISPVWGMVTLALGEEAIYRTSHQRGRCIMGKIAIAPIAILALMLFTWVVAIVATYTGRPGDDYDYEADHATSPSKQEKGRAA
jgi:hypothetical protein